MADKDEPNLDEDVLMAGDIAMDIAERGSDDDEEIEPDVDDEAADYGYIKSSDDNELGDEVFTQEHTADGTHGDSAMDDGLNGEADYEGEEYEGLAQL